MGSERKMWLYHKKNDSKTSEAKVFSGDEIEVALKGGWQDSPSFKEKAVETAEESKKELKKKKTSKKG